MNQRRSGSMESFYKGVNPQDLRIFNRIAYTNVGNAVAGYVEIFTPPALVPRGMMIDISFVEFTLVGRLATNGYEYPRDYGMTRVAYQLTINNRPAWNVVRPGNIVDGTLEFPGVDISGGNVFDLLGATEGHIICNEGDVIGANARGLDLISFNPGVNYVCCKLGGTEFSKDVWQRQVER